jgi:hypothetical protein
MATVPDDMKNTSSPTSFSYNIVSSNENDFFLNMNATSERKSILKF